MKSKTKEDDQMQFLAPELTQQLNPKEPLYRLALAMPWEEFDKEFGAYYSQEGRPAKPIRLMVSLLMLKQLYNFGDETAVAHWSQNAYWQFFSGERVFQWGLPVEPSDLVHFRHRIGESGVEKILAISIRLHGGRAKESEVIIDSTVQEKAITFPTDTKLHRKIVVRCGKIARREGIKLRQSYVRVAKKLILAQRGRNRARTHRLAMKAARRLKTIAGRLVRELGRKLSSESKHQADVQLFGRVLAQKKSDSNKIYSLHEPQVYCMSKGKEHKKYEFGAKASLVMTKNNGIMVGALSFAQNLYDGHTLVEVLEQTHRLTGQQPSAAIVDKGYRGRRQVGETQILIPKRGVKDQSPYQKQKMKKRFRRRAAIEPMIAHLKSDFRLGRNYLKGSIGDCLNLMLAAAASNFRKWLRLAESFWLHLFLCLRSSPSGFIHYSFLQKGF